MIISGGTAELAYMVLAWNSIPLRRSRLHQPVKARSAAGRILLDEGPGKSGGFGIAGRPRSKLNWKKQSS